MKQVNCPICGSKCVKNGKLKSGNQRWLCKSCKLVFTPKIDNDTKQLQQFLAWLFSKEVQSNMSGGGRSFGIYGLCHQRLKNQKMYCI